jgi:hypothetical protein
MKFVAYTSIIACELHCLEADNSKRCDVESNLYKKIKAQF